MATQTRQRAVEAALIEQARAERYQDSQREAKSRRLDGAHRARPLEFDESGFPIPQPNPRFVTRVARLLRGI